MLSKGSAYEQQAKKYLIKKGLTHLISNYRSKCGEIDLIMKDEDTIVFVEVKFRQSERYGSAAEVVTTWKQKRICKTAGLFLTQKNLWLKPCRFDVVTVSYDNKSQKQLITWYKAAFDTSN